MLIGITEYEKSLEKLCAWYCPGESVPRGWPIFDYMSKWVEESIRSKAIFNIYNLHLRHWSTSGPSPYINLDCHTRANPLKVSTYIRAIPLKPSTYTTEYRAIPLKTSTCNTEFGPSPYINLDCHMGQPLKAINSYCKNGPSP